MYIYIDSFKNDHSNDPLLTIFSAITSEIDDSETKRDLKKAVLPVLGFGLKTLGKAGISWALKKDPDMLIDEFEEVVSDTADAAFNAMSNKLISDHQEEEGHLLALKEALELATKKNKLVVFLDELDRCRKWSGKSSSFFVFDKWTLLFIMLAFFSRISPKYISDG